MTLRRVWQSVTEPRTLKAVFAVAYVIALATGAVTLVDPPQSIEGVLGSVTPYWASFLVIGGLGALLAVFPGWWWAEKLAVILIMTGLGTYAFVISVLHFISEGSRLTQLGAVALGIMLCIVRLVLTKGFGFEPRPRG